MQRLQVAGANPDSNLPLEGRGTCENAHEDCRHHNQWEPAMGYQSSQEGLLHQAGV